MKARAEIHPVMLRKISIINIKETARRVGSYNAKHDRIIFSQPGILYTPRGGVINRDD